MTITKQRGASTIEMAIVLPLLLLVLFAIIQFSLALFNQALLTNASREGARAGIVYNIVNQVRTPLTDAQIRAIVYDYLGGASAPRLISFGVRPVFSPSVISRPEGQDPGDPLIVTVNYSYNFTILQPIATLSGGAIPATINQSARSRMRFE